MPDSEAQRTLRTGLERLEIALNDDQIDQLLQYLKLLLHWNKAYNLIAEAPQTVLVARHLLDSLAVLPHLKGTSAVDLGTGAGLPGLPLALAAPERRWWLVDSAGKRIRFLRHVVRELGLTQVYPQESRMEQWPQSLSANPRLGLPHERLPEADEPAGIILRAVATPEQILSWAGHLLVPGRRLYLMLGHDDAADWHHLPEPYQLEQLIPLRVPYISGARNLAIVTVS